jgi:hypothetical protein
MIITIKLCTQFDEDTMYIIYLLSVLKLYVYIPMELTYAYSISPHTLQPYDIRM